MTFLAMCLDVGTNNLNADYAEEAWPSVEARMRAVLGSIQTANRVVLLTSFVIHQSRSGSPAKSMDFLNEIRDVVP